MSIAEQWRAFSPFWRGFIKSVTLLGAALAAVASGGKAWIDFGWPVPATRSYVAEYVSDQVGTLKTTQNDTRVIATHTQIDLAEMRRNQVADQIIRWNLELQKAVDQQTREMIQSQLNVLTNQERVLDEQIDTLRRGR